MVGPAEALTYVKVSQAEKHLGPKPQSLTSTSFCNHPSPSLLLPLPLSASLSPSLSPPSPSLSANCCGGLVSLRREVTQYYCSACLRGAMLPSDPSELYMLPPVSQVSYICSRQMGSQAFQCPLSSCVILTKSSRMMFSILPASLSLLLVLILPAALSLLLVVAILCSINSPLCNLATDKRLTYCYTREISKQILRKVT